MSASLVDTIAGLCRSPIRGVFAERKRLVSRVIAAVMPVARALVEGSASSAWCSRSGRSAVPLLGRSALRRRAGALRALARRAARRIVAARSAAGRGRRGGGGCHGGRGDGAASFLDAFAAGRSAFWRSGALPAGSVGGATPVARTPVTQAVAQTFAATPPPPAPRPAASGTNGAAIAAAPARREVRARLSSWRTAPLVTPSATAISS